MYPSVPCCEFCPSIRLLVSSVGYVAAAGWITCDGRNASSEVLGIGRYSIYKLLKINSSCISAAI